MVELDVLGSWFIVEIDGAPVVEGTAPTIDFAPDGRVFGSASVNRYHGSYTLVDEVVEFGPLASTLMMGLPDPQAQEDHLHQLLRPPLEVTAIDGSDDLLLHHDEGSIRLRRAGRDEVVISGNVVYREPLAMPPGAVVRVDLVVAEQGRGGDVVASTLIADPGNVPVPFEFRVPAGTVDGNVEITLGAGIEVDGDRWWRSDEVDVVVGDDGLAVVEVLVRRVPS